MSTITVNPATLDDLDDVARLFCAYLAFYEVEHDPDQAHEVETGFLHLSRESRRSDRSTTD